MTPFGTTGLPVATARLFAGIGLCLPSVVEGAAAQAQATELSAPELKAAWEALAAARNGGVSPNGRIPFSDGLVIAWRHELFRRRREIPETADKILFPGVMEGEVKRLEALGFENPRLALTVTDIDRELLDKAFLLCGGNTPPYTLLGALAWCKNHNLLPEAFLLLERFRVPVLELRRMANLLGRLEYHSVVDREKFRPIVYGVLYGMRDIEIPDYQWYFYFKTFLDYVGEGESAPAKLPLIWRALGAAKEIGFRPNMRGDAASVILQDGTDEHVRRLFETKSTVPLRERLIRHWFRNRPETAEAILQGNFPRERVYEIARGEAPLNENPLTRARIHTHDGPHPTGGPIRWSKEWNGYRAVIKEGFASFRNQRWAFVVYPTDDTSDSAMPVMTAFALLSTPGQTLFVQTLQSDIFRRLSPEQRRPFQDWEALFLEGLGMIFRERGIEQLYLNTFPGILLDMTVLEDASLFELLRIYGEVPAILPGFAPVRVEPHHPIHELHKKSAPRVFSPTILRYYWRKSIGDRNP